MWSVFVKDGYPLLSSTIHDMLLSVTNEFSLQWLSAWTCLLFRCPCIYHRFNLTINLKVLLVLNRCPNLFRHQDLFSLPLNSEPSDRRVMREDLLFSSAKSNQTFGCLNEASFAGFCNLQPSTLAATQQLIDACWHAAWLNHDSPNEFNGCKPVSDWSKRQSP
jgi:hypothetical protein